MSVALTTSRGIRPPLVSAVASSYLAILFLYVAGLFIQEARHTAGVTARRLSFAAIGTSIFAFGFGLVVLASFASAIANPWLPLARITARIAGLACYFVAFSTPRWLKGQWQRGRAGALSDGHRRPRRRRAQSHAANDLLHTVTRSVGHSLVVVALRPATTSDDVVVREATDRGVLAMIGTTEGSSACRAERHARTGAARRLRGDPRRAALGERAGRTDRHDLPRVGRRARRAAARIAVSRGRPPTAGPGEPVCRDGTDHAGLIADARERERRRADRRLQAAESRMGLMLESIRDYAMFVLDLDGLIVMWPAGAAHLFEYTSDEITGDSASPLFNLLADGSFSRAGRSAATLGRAQWEAVPPGGRTASRFLGGDRASARSPAKPICIGLRRGHATI